MCFLVRPAARPVLVAWRSQPPCPSYRWSVSADPPELRERPAHHRLGRGDTDERSSFHRHVRAITSVTPLLFQLQLRLNEAPSDP
jgi:hypothetical protein